MIRTACSKPQEKVQEIQRALEEVDGVNKQTKTDYGFTIDHKAVKLQGRVLPSPSKLGVSRGAWRMNRVVAKGATNDVGTVGVVVLCSSQSYTEDVHNAFAAELNKGARSLGILDQNMNFGRPHYCRVNNLPDFSKCPFKYTFVILDNQAEADYGRVKLEEREGCKLQCIKLETVLKVCGRGRGPDLNTTHNILKKFNVKIGGVNFGVQVQGLPSQIFRERVMIVGADVTHFTRDSLRPSLAAIVASTDNTASRYISRLKALYPEPGRKSVEHIRGMEALMKSILWEYKETAKRATGGKVTELPKLLPMRIIYYRDGVSVGQFENTVMEELQGIQDACQAIDKRYTPKISVVVCTKRHKQRFVVANGGKVDNMAPGTVVDSGVTDPNHFNFYLNSQQAIQGTSVPCHYYVLYDDNKLSGDMWQMLSFYLCHTYARCSRIVSYPAPVYYAHLACASARARMLAMAEWSVVPETGDWAPPSEAVIEKRVKPGAFNMFFI